MKLNLISLFVVSSAIFGCSSSTNNRKPTADTSNPQPQVYTTLELDLNKDGKMDRVQLIESTREVDTADLHIVFSTDIDPKLFIKKSIVFRGVMEGTFPYLRKNLAGNLEIVSQSRIGRHHWEQVLTVSSLKKSLVVSRFVFNEGDSIDLGAVHSCDLNYLQRTGFRNKRNIASTLSPITLQKWNGLEHPPECGI